MALFAALAPVAIGMASKLLNQGNESSSSEQGQGQNLLNDILSSALSSFGGVFGGDNK